MPRSGVMTWRPVRVEAYAGSRADEEPRALVVDGVRREVEVVDRWREGPARPGDPAVDHVRVRGSDGAVHHLRCDAAGSWEIDA